MRWASARGVPVLGACLYPVLGHLGWDEDRYCPNGLLEWDAASSGRAVHRPLADVVRRHGPRLSGMVEAEHLVR